MTPGVSIPNATDSGCKDVPCDHGPPDTCKCTLTTSEDEPMTKPILMRYETCAPVPPAHVQAYLDDGWTIAEGAK